MKNKNDLYLSNWLASKISDEDLKKLVSETDFIAYKKLRSLLEQYEIKSPNMEQNFKSIHEKINLRKNKIENKKPISIWQFLAIAASLILFFGTFQLFYNSNTILSESGKTKTIVLSDKSQVTLNTKSKISYPNLFKYNRTLHLEGEAFFEVEKGSTFTVKTPFGSIKVLGTKFNVNSTKNYFEVICYKGSVRVEHEGIKTILKANDAVRFYEKKQENWRNTSLTSPMWITGESNFKKTPIKYVFESFERQYNVTIKYPKKIDRIKFTGSFTNNNIETALKSICIPLNLKFNNNNKGIILIY
jgi:ferric-dicitrate binding protein FerR (iron transport regulator)